MVKRLFCGKSQSESKPDRLESPSLMDVVVGTIINPKDLVARTPTR
jgi:hypothetical protein